MIKMEHFKKYFNIEKEITLVSKVENDRLFVFYQNQWAQLSLEKDPNKCYSPGTLQHKYKSSLLKELGLPTHKGNKYNREYYLKNRKAFCKASKKYYMCAKKKAQ